MRVIVFLPVAAFGLIGCGLMGCSLSAGADVGIGAGVTLISLTAIGRSPVDAAYSLITGRDCSVARLDAGTTYCRPVEPPPEQPVFCTRSLGSVNCWADPATLPGHPRSVADGPVSLTPAQEADRLRTWP